MFVETCCSRCGKNSVSVRNPQYSTKTFTTCSTCGGFSFIIGFNNYSGFSNDNSIVNSIPSVIRCLSYENLVNTVRFLNDTFGNSRYHVNLLAAAYSYYHYGESNAYKTILDLHSYKFNLTVLPVVSAYREIYFMNTEHFDLFKRNLNVLNYHLINSLHSPCLEPDPSDENNVFLYYYICYLTLLKILDGHEEFVTKECKIILSKISRINISSNINKTICSKINVSHDDWFEAMSLFVDL